MFLANYAVCIIKKNEFRKNQYTQGLLRMIGKTPLLCLVINLILNDILLMYDCG